MNQPLPKLSLGEQVGQVILAVWQGDWEHLAPLVAQGQVGGVLFPAGAGPEAGCLATLLNRLQRLSSYPLLVAADLANPGLWNLRGPALGAAHTPGLSRQAGLAIARQARAQGVHLLLGPTFDVPRTAAPSQGAGNALTGNPSLAGTLAAAFVAGCWDGGAVAVGRHFPGRGAAICDSAKLPILPQRRQDLEKIDLVPYTEARRAGLAAIMSGHLHVTAVDNLPNRLATHSSFVVEGLLRNTLGFDGLLLSDLLEDPAVARHYAPGQAAVLAFAAGHDMLATVEPEAVYRALYEVALHGDIPADRLDEAVRRIGVLKERLGLFDERSVEPTPQPAGGAGSLARTLAQAALVAVRGRPQRVPGRACLLTHAASRSEGTARDGNLQQLATRYLGATPFHVLAARPSPAQIDVALTSAGTVDMAIILLSLPQDGQRTGAAAEALVAMAQAIKRMGTAVGVIVAGDAQMLPRFPSADLLLYLPGDGPEYLEAAMDYLLGRGDAPGRLPVAVPGL